MDTLLEMHDFAAFLMESREYKSALEILNYCLTHVPKNKHSSIDKGIMKRHKATIKKGDQKKTKRSTSSDSKGFVYRNPLRLCAYELTLPNVDKETVLCSNFIFNVALCHHLIALEACSSTYDVVQHDVHYIKRLRGALKLYELGFQLHSKKGVEGMNMNFALALINNCANIYEILGCTTKAERFYSHMLSSLMMMIDGGEAEKVDELDGYLQNATRIILRAENAAAAA
jgi:hypothetical protein